MALKQVPDAVAGPPWQPALRGRVDQLVVDSEVLADNPLGDPARRPLYVYLPPGLEPGAPVIYMLQGFTGQLDRWLARDIFEPTIFERLDAMFAAPEVPRAAVVFVDAWTSLGGSQFLNSPALGRYTDYICDEVLPFIDSRYGTDPGRRGIAGKSSGGYGALVLPMLRPGLFAALAAHAGDALFEVCCLPEFRTVVRTLRDHFDGSYDVLFERLAAAERFDFRRFGGALEMYTYAAAYSPDPDNPVKPLLPFDLRTGRLIQPVWERWLAWDPVRMIPERGDALRGMRRVLLEAGRWDEPYLDLGAQAVSDELAKLGIAHTFELFDGGHGGINYRYPPAIRELIVALDA
ncbi:MAG: hypothetical protein J2O48_01485 [Solirubrobacterales bacterium]|nr:hypothetical protein [Solirubrobacterales bacterium]